MQIASDANFREDIADVLVSNQLGAGQFNGEAVFPVVGVNAQDGRFHKIDFDQVKTRAVDDAGGSRDAANEVTHETTVDTWLTKLYKLKELITRQDAVRFDDVFDAEVSAAELCKYYIKLNRELRISTLVEAITNTAAATTIWSTGATATPVDDVANAKLEITKQLNGMVMEGRAQMIGVGNAESRKDLVNTADIKDRWTQGNTKSSLADLSDEQIATALGLDSVHFSTLSQGGSDIWDATKFTVALVSADPMFKNVPRVGNTLLWQSYIPTDLQVRTWEQNDPEGEVVLVETDTDEKLIEERAGFVISGV